MPPTGESTRESQDPTSDTRIADLDRVISRFERHSVICSCLNLQDAMYELVWVVDRKAKGNPSVQCRACLTTFVGRACLTTFVGDPERIMAHSVGAALHLDARASFFIIIFRSLI